MQKITAGEDHRRFKIILLEISLQQTLQSLAVTSLITKMLDFPSI